MKRNTEIKTRILQQKQELLSTKIKDAEQAIASAKESRNNDTKSSAGDKYETGRAMMQMEIDNNELQLDKALQQLSELSKIELNTGDKKVTPDSLVFTNYENYFISIAMGKIEIDGQIFYAISMVSPVGTLLRNKTIGDKVDFQGRTIIIQQIL